ncbi:hypothetical protein GCM10022243_41080 [Saccharothrix violaceirubra]|uniref:Flagellar FliJ protein n=1 Tax=Saccharothrix violaceirubra TaxID=413306 RepID=A0A7W7T867_9PSEU|nr:flagellar FliJ family protein [Saccharothrix violaceirubra]MBB4968364.1 flagellar export protein FliJ [Saccharothrix violaceirubra]
MSVKSRLAAVLRARRAQEDMARGAVAKATMELRRAHDVVTDHEDALADHSLPEEADPRAYLAAIAAGRSLASALDQAVSLARSAEVDADTTYDLLRAAARRRRGVEKLVERAAEARRLEELAAEQRDTDELSTRGWEQS